MSSRPRPVRAPELALVRAVDVAGGATAVVGGLVLLGAALASGHRAAAGVGAGLVLALALLAVTRRAVLGARSAPTDRIGQWVVLSYAGKFALALVTALLVKHAEADVSTRAFALALLVGVVLSVGLQVALTQSARTPTVDEPTRPSTGTAGKPPTAGGPASGAHGGADEGGDPDDRAVREARERQAGLTSTPGSVRPR